MKEKLGQGRYFAYLHTNTKGLNEFMSDNNARNPEQTYIAVDGPKNSNGDDSTFTGGNIGRKSCKVPPYAPSPPLEISSAVEANGTRAAPSSAVGNASFARRE